MFSRTTIIATVAIAGTAFRNTMAAHSVALAANVDDPTSFGQDTATMHQNSTLADRFFHVEWTAGAGRAGMSRITGYVYDDYGHAAEDVELRITGLDAAGQPVITVFQHLSDTVPARGRSTSRSRPASPTR